MSKLLRALSFTWHQGNEPGLALPAARVLAELPATVPLFHDDYGLRHPLGTYNVSADQVAQRGMTVCRGYPKTVLDADRCAC